MVGNSGACLQPASANSRPAKRALHLNTSRQPTRIAQLSVTALETRYDNAARSWMSVTRVSSPTSLKTKGLKATLPRLRILELFEKSDVRHLAAEDVYRMLLKEGTDTGLATVYRVLTQFEQAGLLVRHHFESDKAVFELNQGGHHDHLVCLQCGRVEEFYDEAIEKRQTTVAQERGFEIREHSLHMYVDCTKTNCPNKSRR
jgi:Fur family ferric uptake transcriptional regulator